MDTRGCPDTTWGHLDLGGGKWEHIFVTVMAFSGTCRAPPPAGLGLLVHALSWVGPSKERSSKQRMLERKGEGSHYSNPSL